MKNATTQFFTVILLVVSSILYSQSNDNSWVFSAGVNAIDIRVPTDFKSVVKDYFNGSIQDLNYYGVPLRLTAEKDLNKGLTVQLATSLNKLKRGFHPSQNDISSTSFFMIDAKLKYGLAYLFKKKTGWFDPFTGVGIGYSSMHFGNDLKFSVGGGFNINLPKDFGLSFESFYHHAFNPLGTDFFQNSIGVRYRPTFRSKNTIPKDNDSDNDGVIDAKDKCPKTFGSVEFDGCEPTDKDGDGIPDNEDACPFYKGLKYNKGCPDSDGDGIIDSEDECPSSTGSAANKGCPSKDTDEDGIIDSKDKCPTVFGHKENNGCPIKYSANFKDIDVFFDVDTYKLTKEKEEKLRKLIYTFKNATGRFVIKGHTDSGGSENYNHLLSDKRANAVKAFLIREGVNSNKLLVIGMGEEMPDSDNNTETGRAFNRRVTISKIDDI